MTSSRSPSSAVLVIVTAAATAMLMQACGGSDAVAQTAPGADPIEGTWESVVTAKDCASGATVDTFGVLLLFHRGGTMEADIAPYRTLRGDIFAVWTRGTGPAYTADAVHWRYAADGSLVGKNKIRRTTTLGADGNSFTSELAIQVLDTTGAVLGQGCASETATRITF
jgi:hypothetical protein